MAGPSNVAANNLIIQGVTDDKITLLVDGKAQEIDKRLDVLQTLMEQMATKSVQSANKIYNIGSITNANFGFVMGQAGHDKSLPSELAQNLVGEGNGWIKSLQQELVKQGIAVGNQPWNIFQNYGWLVETFLSKLCTAPGQEKTLRRLSFMAEAYQASLRYLCYVQIAQILQMGNKPKMPIMSEFIQMEGNQYLSFHYMSLLLIATDALAQNGYMKEIPKFTNELKDTGSALYGTALFLNNKRQDLRDNKIPEDEALPRLLDEYLTALVYWLRKVSFIAKYRLVSIKDINLNYSLGTAVNFVHLFGELHGIYSAGDAIDEDYNKKSLEGSYTFNKSILLFKGTDVSSAMDNIQDQRSFLSLSPFVIDQSVFAAKATQTPEIGYYTGYEKSKRQYNYSQYKNELSFGESGDISSNKSLTVSEQNNHQPPLDNLFEQLEDLLNPFK
ncbi:hypothetical protein GS399_17050 [Pedobacter sp. HMF7647]|uniref:Uncharacterized protein n=1 Tax=Hufsiella arboris TaxID=2695275 RepID=A0A7K1YDL1_9SPHI|nr:hypothetical protein [Hufsiella arboris]MXV52683.1 hypothetical protein [Hufsiella arboris]